MKVRLLQAHYVKAGAQIGSEHDVNDALAQRLIEQGAAEAIESGAAPIGQDNPDDSWTVRALEAYAGEHNIDLGDATKKADILDVIHASRT